VSLVAEIFRCFCTGTPIDGSLIYMDVGVSKVGVPHD